MPEEPDALDPQRAQDLPVAPVDGNPGLSPATGDSWESPAGTLMYNMDDIAGSGTVMVSVPHDDHIHWGRLGTTDDGLMSIEGLDDELSAEGQRELAAFLAPFVGQPVTEVAERLGIRRRPAPAEPGLVDKLDRAIDGLCPCGAEPDPGFYPYCGERCTPTHAGRHTDNRPAETPSSPQARWRPDLLAAADDTGLSPLTDRGRHQGRWRQVFLRDGTDRVHLRVDDDNLFVGGDMAREVYESDLRAVEQRWEALTRELNNTRNKIVGGFPGALTSGAGSTAPAYRRSGASSGVIRLTVPAAVFEEFSEHMSRVRELFEQAAAELQQTPAALTAARWRELVAQLPGQLPAEFQETLEEIGEVISAIGGRITSIDVTDAGSAEIEADCTCPACSGEIEPTAAVWEFADRFRRRLR
jgi:hypothetical protein